MSNVQLAMCNVQCAMKATVGKMTNKKAIPEIRFKGFTEAWEQRKLGEVFESLQNNTLSRAELSLSQGNAKSVHYGDILVKYGEVLNIGEEQLPMIADDAVIAKFKSSFLQNGDVIVADTAEDETVGKCAEIAGLQGENVISGLHTIPYRPLFKFASGYLGYYMNSAAYHNQLLPLMQGIKVTSISKSAMQNTDIVYPKSLDEQKQIGEYFRNLDRLITLHQRKYEKLHNIKKSMLEKMFPKNGSNVPEIRFKGFTEAWEQRKLGETVQITMGQSPDGNTYSDVPSDYILVQGNADLQNGWVSPRAWTSQMTKKADAGDLIMSVRAPAGAMGKTAYNAVIGRGVAAIKGNEFIYQLLVKMDSDGYWKALSCGSTFESLNSDNIKNADVLIPDVAEQEKIGQYFANLDRLITLHQRELEKLQNIKQAMLEKMFKQNNQ